ncbi:hypothetical protein GCM10009810_13230 [Nostocoides vanveenii]|uniref:Uncharacterized protein n=1 Tax=Nostocoides vanveenii TaxID=330835 RepID=A0ABN2KFK3_9MICO
MAVRDEFRHPHGRDADAELVVLDLAGDADLHCVTPLSGKGIRGDDDVIAAGGLDALRQAFYARAAACQRQPPNSAKPPRA